MFEDMVRSSTVLRRLGTVSGHVIRVTSPWSFLRAIAEDKDYAEWCAATWLSSVCSNLLPAPLLRQASHRSVSLRDQLSKHEGFAWDTITPLALIICVLCRVGYQTDRWSVFVFFAVYTLCIILIFVCNWALARDPLPATNVNT